MVILPDKISEVRPEASTSNPDTTSLRIQFYVKLPSEVGRSPHRSTNYVVPKDTLSRIVSQDREVIGAVVRNSVSPSLTEVVLDLWKVVASVCISVISVGVTAAVIAGVCYAAYKYKQM